MEDALAPDENDVYTKGETSLNPCCNGRCTRTHKFDVVFNNDEMVLILVVMEDALALWILAPI